MRRLITSRPSLWAIVAILLTIGPWGMLWLSISPGDPAAILHPGSLMAFADGTRAVFPMAAAAAAIIVIRVKTVRSSSRKFGLFGPLGLATVYGLTGLVASLKSPDGSAALWWATLYLSVPIVLWGAAWGAAPLDQLRRLVDATWLAVILATAALFVVAVLNLDIIDQILKPNQLMECQPAGWFKLTAGNLRSTGVGRYAAIAGIIALSGMWQARWRPIWIVMFLTSVTLLLHTSARGSLVGFAVGATLVVAIYMYHASRRVLLWSLLAILVAVPLVLSTGAPIGLLKTCVLRVSAAPPLFEASSSGTGATTSDNSPNLLEQEPSEGRPRGEAPSKSPTFKAPSDDIPIGARVQKWGAKEIFKLSGRTAVWADGIGMIKNSPAIGYGFHADRLLLGTHMHNAVLHATLQTGLFGAIPFVAAMFLAWILFFRIVRKLNAISGLHKRMAIQCGGVLAFLTVRSFPESTGALFGVDWLILAPVLFYLQLINEGFYLEHEGGIDRA